MKGLLLAAAVLAYTIAAPQFKLSQKSYVGLEQALAGRIPVGIYSANRIYHAYEDNDNNVVVLNFPGLSSDSRQDLAPVAPGAADASAAAGGREAPVARTRTGPADVVAASLIGAAEVAAEDLTLNPAVDGVVRPLAIQEDVADALEDAAEDAAEAARLPAAPIRNLDDLFDSLEDAAEDAAEAAEDAAEDAAEAAVAAALGVRTVSLEDDRSDDRSDDLADALEDAAEDAAEAAEDAAEAAVAAALGVRTVSLEDDRSDDRSDDLADALEDAAEDAAEAAEDAAEAAVAAALGVRTVSLEDDRSDDLADALEDAAEDAAEAAEDAAEDAAEAEVAAALVRSGIPAAVAAELADEATDDIVRRKRQGDGDEDDDIFGSLTTADRVSFALSGLGTILGINLGQWLDTTHEANVKLIDGMESVGTIVLNQVDTILERANDPNRTKSDKFSLF